MTICFPRTAAIPAARPPMIPVTNNKVYGLPPRYSNSEMREAKVKSLPMLSIKLCKVQRLSIARKGTTNTAAFFRGINKDVTKAEVITDHQGKTIDRTTAKIMVLMKLIIFLFICGWY